MDLSHPLGSFFPRMDAAALRALSRIDSSVTGRQLAHIIDTGTPANARLALLRLVDIGLVRADARPHATMYRANREHILWPAIERLLGAEGELFTRIRDFAERSASRDVGILLYGSVARGESTSRSDVDLLVVFPATVSPDDRVWYLSELEEAVERWTGNAAQCYDTDGHDLAHKMKIGDPILESWGADAIPIVGPAFREHLAGAMNAEKSHDGG